MDPVVRGSANNVYVAVTVRDFKDLSLSLYLGLLRCLLLKNNKHSPKGRENFIFFFLPSLGNRVIGVNGKSFMKNESFYLVLSD